MVEWMNGRRELLYPCIRVKDKKDECNNYRGISFLSARKSVCKSPDREVDESK